MAEINLSLADLFAQAFGYKTEAFKPNFARVVGDGGPNSVTRAEYGKVAGSPYYQAFGKGQEVYLPIELQVGNDNAEALGVTNSTGALTGSWFLPFPVFSIEGALTVIDTDLTERRGMVSELINVGGYKLRVKGMLINVNNEFPEDDFATLTRLFELAIPVRIKNPITDILFMKTATNGEAMVTIRNLQLPDVKGVKNVRPYTCDLVQEVPFNLIDIS